MSLLIYHERDVNGSQNYEHKLTQRSIFLATLCAFFRNGFTHNYIIIS